MWKECWSFGIASSAERDCISQLSKPELTGLLFAIILPSSCGECYDSQVLSAVKSSAVKSSESSRQPSLSGALLFGSVLSSLCTFTEPSYMHSGFIYTRSSFSIAPSTCVVYTIAISFLHSHTVVIAFHIVYLKDCQ